MQNFFEQKMSSGTSRENYMFGPVHMSNQKLKSMFVNSKMNNMLKKYLVVKHISSSLNK